MTIRERLFALRDEEYAAFHGRLVPNIPGEKIIGVRIPALRTIAAEIKGSREAEEFITSLPHDFLEENNLHALLINAEKDYNTCLKLLRDFLPQLDNWASCDLLRPSCFGKNRKALAAEVRGWLSSDAPYTVRFGLETLMTQYLDGDFCEEYLTLAAGVESGDYYVKMMQAWYFAEALVKQPQSALPFMERRVLPLWVHNKAIQKALESRRISEEQKQYLKALKRREGAVEVAAALIWEDGKFMICRRPPHKTRGMLWEFPGGKLEKGETPKEALVRECKEELDITVSVQDVFISLFHKYPDMTVHLTLFNCAVASGTPKLLEHSEIKYITPSEINLYDFCPADGEILEKLKECRQ